jgi:hypothetical protein
VTKSSQESIEEIKIIVDKPEIKKKFKPKKQLTPVKQLSTRKL